MTRHARSTRDNDLVKVVYANDQIDAEFVQGLLREADVGSVVRRAPGQGDERGGIPRSTNDREHHAPRLGLHRPRRRAGPPALLRQRGRKD